MTLEEPRLSPTFTHLRREVSFAATLVGEGLTMLRRVGVGSDFEFYSGAALFALGFERILKLSLSYSTFVRTGSLPTRREFKNWGHDLDEQWSALQADVDDLGLSIEFTPSWARDDMLGPATEALVILTDVAYQERYFNLNHLAGSLEGKDRLAQDPYARWSRNVIEPLRPEPREIDPDLLERLKGSTVMQATASDGRILTGVEEVMRATDVARNDGLISQRAGLLLVQPACKALVELEDVARFQHDLPAPFSREILDAFMWPETLGDTDRKTWRPFQ